MTIRTAERCGKCNHIVSEDGSTICTACGKRIVGPDDVLETTPCPGCGHPMQPHFKFCPKCGTIAEKGHRSKCPNCGGDMDGFHCTCCGYSIAKPPVCGIMAPPEPPKEQKKWWKRKK